MRKLRFGRSWRPRKRSGYHLALQAQKEPHQGRRHLQARNTPRGVGRLSNTAGQYSDALRALYRILLRHWPWNHAREKMASGHVAQQAEIPPEVMAKASLVGMYTVGFPLTPLTPSFFLLVGLAGVNIGAHLRHMLP